MSIKGKLKLELTKETIFGFISHYDVYRKFFGDFKLNKVTCNHLRGDHVPSFIIGSKFNELTHRDFANDKWKGNCINLVQQIYSCSYIEALKIIDKEFNLKISYSNEYPQEIIHYEQPEIEEKQYSNIQCVTRNFTNEELQYWNSYHITIDELKANNVFSISKLFLNKEKYPLKETELRFVYLYQDKIKLYRPFNDSKTKWLSNVPLTVLDSPESILNCETAWITKSKKDRLILSKLYPNVISTQNESRACFSKENIDYIKSNSKRQILMYDSDKAGCKASLQITKEFNFDYCNTPRNYLSDGLVDFSDIAKVYGINTIEKILKRKKLL